MLENGLIEEMNKIENPSKTVLQAIGMNLSNDLEENINLKTNRLAKKQLTWFKQEDRIKIIETTEENIIRGELENILDGK
jgi:tRNA A37 N6-isopentenylltransferase MiaA